MCNVKAIKSAQVIINGTKVAEVSHEVIGEAKNAPAPVSVTDPIKPEKVKPAPVPVPVEPVAPVPNVPASVQNAPVPAKEEPARPAFEVVDYSEKSFAVFGDTKPIRAQLKKAGGRYNPHLRPAGCEEPRAGWIFAVKARAKVNKLLAKVG